MPIYPDAYPIKEDDPRYDPNENPHHVAMNDEEWFEELGDPESLGAMVDSPRESHISVQTSTLEYLRRLIFPEEGRDQFHGPAAKELRSFLDEKIDLAHSRKWGVRQEDTDFVLPAKDLFNAVEACTGLNKLDVGSGPFEVVVNIADQGWRVPRPIPVSRSR